MSKSFQKYRKRFNQKNNDAKKAVGDCILVFLKHNDIGRQASVNKALQQVEALIDMLDSGDVPPWLNSVYGHLQMASRGADGPDEAKRGIAPPKKTATSAPYT